MEFLNVISNFIFTLVLKSDGLVSYVISKKIVLRNLPSGQQNVLDTTLKILPNTNIFGDLTFTISSHGKFMGVLRNTELIEQIKAGW